MVRPGASFPFKAIAARAGSTSPRGAPHHARLNPVLYLLSLSLFFNLYLIFFLIFLHRSPRGCHWRSVKLQRPAMVDGRWQQNRNPETSLLEPGGNFGVIALLRKQTTKKKTQKNPKTTTTRTGTKALMF